MLNNLFVLKDYSLKTSTYSFKDSQFKNEKEIFDYYQKNSKNIEKLNELKKNKDLYNNFIRCITGKKTLPLMYDTVFKKIFDFDMHPERLTSLLTSILRFNVEIKCIESCKVVAFEKSTGVIFDILVRLTDNSLISIEAQKNPHLFTGKRISFYMSTLVIKQFEYLKGTNDYNNLNKVYTIIIFEKTTKEFKENNPDNKFLFHGSMKLNVDVEIDTLEELYIIALDIFNEHEYSISIEDIKRKNPEEISEDEFGKCCDYELSIWLKLLTSKSAEDVTKLAEKYEWIKEIYLELMKFMENPDDMLNMFFSMMAEADRVSLESENNMLRKQIEEDKVVLADAIAEKEKTIAEKEKTIVENKNTIMQNENIINDQDETIRKLFECLEKANLPIPDEISYIKFGRENNK